VEAPACRRAKKPCENVRIQGMWSKAGFTQSLKATGKDVYTFRRGQPAFALEQFINAFYHPTALIFKYVVQKTRHSQDVAAFLLIFAVNGVYRTAHEHPQWFF